MYTHKESSMFSGLRSVIYPSSDLAADKQFWQDVTGVEPYFDQPYYVGFNVHGSELGLDPNAAEQGITYPITYWHVPNTEDILEQLLAVGATIHSEARDVGEGIKLATFKDRNGHIFGIIDNPNS